MGKTKTLGQELIDAIKEALASKEAGRIVRLKFDIASLREGLGMTQKEFATQYHIKLQTLRNWEQDKRLPDTTTLAYLSCIAQCPELIRDILNQRTN
jgi:putative transcriptional regulator